MPESRGLLDPVRSLGLGLRKLRGTLIETAGSARGLVSRHPPDEVGGSCPNEAQSSRPLSNRVETVVRSFQRPDGRCLFASCAPGVPADADSR